MKRALFCLAVLQLSWVSVTCAKDSRHIEVEPSETAGRQAVKEQVRSLVEDFAVGHNGRGRTAYAKVVEIGKAAVPHLAKALKDPRKNVRWLSVEALGAIGGDEALPPLMAALGDADKDVRRYAAAFLGRWGGGNTEVIAALAEVLYDPDPEVVWHAIQALEELGETGYKRDLRLVDILCAHLEGPDERYRADAAHALGMIGSSRACGPLVKALARRETSSSCRNTIANALGAIGSHDAVPLLVRLLKDEAQEKKVRYSAAGILGELADPSVNAELLDLTESPAPWLRKAALKGLGFKQNAAAVTRLAAIVADETEQDGVREGAAESLGRIGDPRAVDALGKALAAKDDSIRRMAAWALGEIGSPKAVPILMRALKDPVCYVAMYAAQSLGRIGDRKAAPAIVELFDRDDALESRASSTHFFNVATVANRALQAITEEAARSRKVLVVDSQEQLEEIRQTWRRKLGLEGTELAPPGR